MSLNQNGYKQQVYNLLPLDKRVDIDQNRNSMVDFLWALLSVCMNWLNFRNFTDYSNGTSYSAYASGTTYNFGDKVQYRKSIYESIVDSNLGNDPVLNPNKWYQRQSNFIGASERIKYVDSKLIFEYALNRWFGGTFRQLPSTSDIYITKNGFYYPSFVVGLGGGSAVGLRDSTGYVGTSLSTPIQYDFTIHIPTSLYPAGGDKEIRQFADQINSAESTYNIVQY